MAVAVAVTQTNVGEYIFSPSKFLIHIKKIAQSYPRQNCLTAMLETTLAYHRYYTCLLILFVVREQESTARRLFVESIA